MYWKALFMAGLVGGAVAILAAQNMPSPALVVLVKPENSLAIVDPATLQVVRRVPVGPDPHEVAVSADGRLAFASNYGAGLYNTIAVVDLTSGTALPSINLGALHGAHGLDFARGKLYFTAESNKTVGSYDPSSERIDWILGTGQNMTHLIRVSPAADRIYVTNVESASIEVIDRTTRPAVAGTTPAVDWKETLVPIGGRPVGFDISPDGRELWSADSQNGVISVVDLAQFRVSATFDPKIAGAGRLRFTPDGQRVLVSSGKGADLTVLDAASHQQVGRVPVGRGAAGILIEPSGSRAYIGCALDHQVTVVDLKTMQVAGHIDMGGQPDGLAWADRQQLLTH